jgi:hypothetical protein
MTVEGDLIPLPDEKATEAQQLATAAEQRAEQNLLDVTPFVRLILNWLTLR